MDDKDFGTEGSSTITQSLSSLSVSLARSGLAEAATAADDDDAGASERALFGSRNVNSCVYASLYSSFLRLFFLLPAPRPLTACCRARKVLI